MIVQASTTPRELVPQNMLRRSMVLQNIDGAITVYVKRERPGGTTVTSADFDFQIPPGGSFALNSLLDGEEAIQDRYTVVAASGTPNIAFFETEQQKR